MGNAICGAIFGIIAFVTYTQSKKRRNAGEINKARIWMIASIMAGAIAVLNIITVIFS